MMSSTPRHAVLAAAVLASELAAAGAQQAAQDGDGASPGSGGGQQDQVSTAMVALLAAVVAVFVFIAASTVYLRHCSGRGAVSTARSTTAAGDGGAHGSSLDAFFASRSSWWQRRRRRRSRGLDAEVVEAFPTMTYAEAKALRVGTKGGAAGGGALECAVCLSEFEDDERLRLLLPKCSHAFHPDCIGEWLAGHVTCPVCRCNLEPEHKDTTSDDGEPTIPLASSISSDTAAALQYAGPLPVAVVIDVVTEEEEEERRQEALDLQRIGTHQRATRSRSGTQPPTAAMLARWHSTGQSHSLAARLDRDLERFTLRLPEHVRREMVAAAAERSSQLRSGRRRAAAEGGARSAPLVGRLGSLQSLLGRTFSGRLSFFSASRVTVGSGGEEVSSSSSYSYARMGGKRVAAVGGADVVPGEEVVAAADEKEEVRQLRT